MKVIFPKLTRRHVRVLGQNKTEFLRGYPLSSSDTCKSTHYLKADAIEQVVTLELRKMTKLLQDDEEAFAALLADKTNKLIGADFLIHCSPQILSLVSTLCCNPYNKGIPVYSPTHSDYTLGRYHS